MITVHDGPCETFVRIDIKETAGPMPAALKPWAWRLERNLLASSKPSSAAPMHFPFPDGGIVIGLIPGGLPPEKWSSLN